MSQPEKSLAKYYDWRWAPAIDEYKDGQYAEFDYFITDDTEDLEITLTRSAKSRPNFVLVLSSQQAIKLARDILEKFAD